MGRRVQPYDPYYDSSRHGARLLNSVLPARPADFAPAAMRVSIAIVLTRKRFLATTTIFCKRRNATDVPWQRLVPVVGKILNEECGRILSDD
jgi:hypothetical protein